MSHIVLVQELDENQWTRYRDIRLAALESDGHAFGGNLDSERLFTESEWRSKARQYIALVAVVGAEDIGMMTVENLKGDFGATSWVGSCWVDPEYRQHGALRALFEYLDLHAAQRDWSVQGLGVWVDNEIAITAYEKLGFEKMGEKQESTRKPGMYYQRMLRKSVAR
ncbi:acetyltransferase [Candidatus Planktophila dulcis]|jgi:ribosomal protein S18 acetylase RimI-like enzyme|nr:GNAT family N-acetyltransferase [Candidatus Planktophila dulcis]ASY15254.1 acetyltransferase [Candidatus Planktophila dulcis]